MLHISHIACFSLSLSLSASLPPSIYTIIYLWCLCLCLSLCLSLYFSMDLSVPPIIYLCVCVYLPISPLCTYLSLTPSFCNSQHRHRQGNSNDEDEEGYATDSGSVMTDYTSDTYNDNYSLADVDAVNYRKMELEKGRCKGGR